VAGRGRGGGRRGGWCRTPAAAPIGGPPGACRGTARPAPAR
jgi:hypothetical protein